MRTEWSEARALRRGASVLLIALAGAAGIGVWSRGAPGIASGQAAAALRKIAEFELPGPPGKRFD